MKAAFTLLTKDAQSGSLHLDDEVSGEFGKTVRDVLEEKHPDPELVCADAYLDESQDSKSSSHHI